MDWIRHEEFFKRGSLQRDQLLAAVIYSAADPPIFPPRMLHLTQLLQFPAHLLRSPADLGQGKITGNAQSTGKQLGFHLGDGIPDFFLDPRAHAWGLEEKREDGFAARAIAIEEGSEEAAGFDLKCGFAGPAEEKQEKDQVAEARVEVSECRRQREESWVMYGRR